jgi:hypothetical protein
MGRLTISHRGNLEGPNPKTENTPEAIERALAANFFVEADVWWIISEGSLYPDNGNFWLGHDQGKILVSDSFLDREKLILHCKNIEAVLQLKKRALKSDYFFHENDHLTLTSKGRVWTYPYNHKNFKGLIAVLPETWCPEFIVEAKTKEIDWFDKDTLSTFKTVLHVYQSEGICTDYPWLFN